MRLTIPTWLTLVRIALIPVLVVVYYLDYRWTNIAATAIFVFASLTDWLDGWIARRYGQYSAFGAFLDPVADKLMVATALFLIVQGHPDPLVGTIDAPIGRYEETKFWDVKEDGKPSQTNFRVLERHEDTTLLELEPVTGRTNQLRIHCQHIGHPIVGDIKRGGREFERMCLHAWKLSFRHPSTQEQVEFEAENSLPAKDAKEYLPANIANGRE